MIKLRAKLIYNEREDVVQEIIKKLENNKRNHPKRLN
jgi:hypothetical protein